MTPISRSDILNIHETSHLALPGIHLRPYDCLPLLRLALGAFVEISSFEVMLFLAGQLPANNPYFGLVLGLLVYESCGENISVCWIYDRAL